MVKGRVLESSNSRPQSGMVGTIITERIVGESINEIGLRRGGSEGSGECLEWSSVGHAIRN